MSEYICIVISKTQGQYGLEKLTNRLNELQSIVGYYEFTTTGKHVELLEKLSTNIVSGILKIYFFCSANVIIEKNI